MKKSLAQAGHQLLDDLRYRFGKLKSVLKITLTLSPILLAGILYVWHVEFWAVIVLIGEYLAETWAFMLVMGVGFLATFALVYYDIGFSKKLSNSQSTSVLKGSLYISSALIALAIVGATIRFWPISGWVWSSIPVMAVLLFLGFWVHNQLTKRRTAATERLRKQLAKQKQAAEKLAKQKSEMIEEQWVAFFRKSLLTGNLDQVKIYLFHPVKMEYSAYRVERFKEAVKSLWESTETFDPRIAADVRVRTKEIVGYLATQTCRGYYKTSGTWHSSHYQAVADLVRHLTHLGVIDVHDHRMSTLVAYLSRH